ncbi:toll/interleukin-1 receptor domain-containing protein [Maribacter sp.]|nr:toll/interleukin-1 receptor domain-containing protein [Maribacter sp.]
MKKEIKLFMAYAPEDEDYQKELSKHLAGLKEDGVISEISAAEVLPGANIMDDLRKRMGQSDIIALLLSADFLGTNHGVELEEMAFAQMAKKGTRLVPVKIREVTLGRAYAQFSMLPGQNKPVDDPEWGSRDAAYANITGGIRQLAESMLEIDPPGRKVGEKTVKKETTNEATPAPGKPVNTNTQGNMGMKIGLGVLAALLIGAGVWYMTKDSSGAEPGKDPIEEVGANTNPQAVGKPDSEPDSNQDQAAYIKAKGIGTINAYKDYLENFPEGDYLTEAESNIARLEEEEYIAAAATEWEKAISAKTIVGYSYYLQNYPHGDSVEVAKERIQELSSTADATRAWEKALNSNTQSSYLLYIQEYGDEGLHYAEAIEKIKGLFNSSGWTYYGGENSDNTIGDDRFYDRLLGEKNAVPKEGDLIIVKKPISVRGGPSKDYDATVALKREAIAEVTKVSDGYWVQVKY